MPIRHALIAMLVAFLWGAQVPAVKIGASELPPILMVAIRFAIMAAVLLPFCGAPRGKQVMPAVWIATLTGAVHFGLLYSGIARIDASTSAIAYQLATPFTVLLALIFVREKLAPRVFVGIALAFLGVVTTVGGIGGQPVVFGVGLVIAAALAFAAGTVLTKRMGPFDPVAITGWTALIAAPELTLISFALEHGEWEGILTASMAAWGALLYTAFSGGLIAFVLWYWLLGRNPVHRLAPFTLLVPVFAVAVSQLILNEFFSPALAAGALLTVRGVALCQHPGRPAAPAAPKGKALGTAETGKGTP